MYRPLHSLLLLAGMTSPGFAMAIEMPSGGSPSLVIAGAYFPAWLVCAFVAVAFAIVAHGAHVAAFLTPSPPAQLLVCLSVGALFGALVWLIWAGL